MEHSLTNGSKNSFWRVELPIYAVTFTNMSHFVLTVAMTGVVQAFPGTSQGALMYLLTITTITGIVGGFVYSFLARAFAKKNLLLAGLALGCACALIYLAFPTRLPLLFIAGAGQGLTCGFISTAFPLLVNTHVDEGERSRVLGFGSGVMQFGRLASLFLGGFLAAIKWNYVYITYGFMLAAFLLVAFLLPRDAPAAKNQDSRRKGEPSGGDRGMGAGGSGLGALKSPGVWQLIVFTLAFGIVQFPVTSHVSLYIEGYGLGQPSMTGTLTALSCALAGVTGFLFAPVYRMTGKRTMPAAFLAVGVGFVAAGLVVSLPTVFFGLALCTVAMAVFVPYTIICAGTVSDRDTAPLLIAAIPALLNLGSFISPQAMDFLSAAFGDGGPVGAYLYAGILAIIAGAVCALRRHAA